MQGLSDIGEANGRFARQFLERAAIAYTGGNSSPRFMNNCQARPVDGQNCRRRPACPPRLPPVNLKPPPLASAGDLELF
jgi:hypothetical protein